MFVAGHHATNNPEFSGFHFSPALGDLSALTPPFPDSSAYGNGPAHQYQPHPQEFEMDSENLLFEGPPWTADQIDELIRNMQTEPSLDYDPQQPNSYMGL
jgi:hypothetical protein